MDLGVVALGLDVKDRGGGDGDDPVALAGKEALERSRFQGGASALAVGHRGGRSRLRRRSRVVAKRARPNGFTR